MLDGERLDDHPAHRHTHHVGPVDAVGVEDGECVTRHVGQRVRRSLLADRRVCEVGRQPHVTVVEAVTWKPPATNFSHHASAIVDGLAAQTVDEQQRRAGGWSEGLVVEFAVVVASEGHGAGT